MFSFLSTGMFWGKETNPLAQTAEKEYTIFNSIANFLCNSLSYRGADDSAIPGFNKDHQSSGNDEGTDTMTIDDVRRILSAEVVCGADRLDTEVHNACGSDMMSDVLAFVKDQAVLLTGLVNPQVIRTAEMMDIVCIVFVRGKMPDPSMIGLAEERGIALLSCGQRMFTACGLLYENGLRGGCE